MTFKNLHILLIEGSASLAELYRRYLARAGCTLSVAGDERSAFKNLQANDDIDLIILDLDFDPETSLEMLMTFRSQYSHCPVIAVTGAASVVRAVEAMKAGASDFLIKPFPTEKLAKAIQDAMIGIEHKRPAAAAEKVYQACIPPGTSRPAHDPYFGGFIGASEAMRTVYGLIENASKSDAGVFITGNSGTGKEICAQAIHKYSAQAKNNFVALNCASIPQALMESELFGHTKGAFTGALEDRQGAAQRADGGTLFLDEICEMHPDTQAKLLRFLQDQRFKKVGGDTEQKINVRIICATNQDPLEAVKNGTFREDLYYRLHVVPIHMPSLQGRGMDVLDLAEFFLKRYNREEQKNFLRLNPQAENILVAYHWPGNVRQLENLIRQIVVLHNGPYIDVSMLPGYLTEMQRAAHRLEEGPSADALIGDEPVTLEDVERHTIMKAIEFYEGNIAKAAQHLGVSPSTLYRKKTAWDKDVCSA